MTTTTEQAATDDNDTLQKVGQLSEMSVEQEIEASMGAEEVTTKEEKVEESTSSETVPEVKDEPPVTPSKSRSDTATSAASTPVDGIRNRFANFSNNMSSKKKPTDVKEIVGTIEYEVCMIRETATV